MDNINNPDKMFNFLTEVENFKSALEMKEILENIENRLRKEFWEEVTNKLSEKINEYNKNKDETSKLNFESAKSNPEIRWFKISKNDWQFLEIDTDGEDVGIKRKSNAEGIESRRNVIEEILKQHELKYQNSTWICWKKFNNYRFQVKDEKIKLLPIMREDTIKECADILFIFVKKLILVCENTNEKLSEPVNV